MEEGHLEQTESEFLLWLYSNQTIYMEDSQLKTMYGVPQGGINSPILFNFAMYFCLREIREKCKDLAKSHLNRTPEIQESIIPSTENTFVYADDLAFHLHGPTSSRALQYYTKDLIQLIQKVASEWGLRINHKKCGLLPLFSSKKRWLDVCYNGIFCGIPIVDEYRYLGITITSNLSIEEHLKKIGKKLPI